MRGSLPYTGHARLCAVVACALAQPAMSQDVEPDRPETGEADAPDAVERPPRPEEGPAAEDAGAREVYHPEDFARFAPRNALDMLEEVPGFTIEAESEARGLGQASGNILINGERISSKSTSASEQIARIPVENVVRIEIVDGASLDIPGLSGRVANIVAQSGGLSGQFEWRPQIATGPSKIRWSQGDISMSGTRGPVAFTLALENPAFYGGSEGPNLVADSSGEVDRRFNTQYSVDDNPTLTGNFAIDLPGTTVANVNLTYEWGIFRAREREFRLDDTLPDYVERLRTTNDTYAYEIGGDIDFALGPGRLRLIALESFDHEDFLTQSIINQEEATDTGTRFTRIGDAGERIGRAEYSWPMWGADWQFSAEAAFNRFDNVASLFAYDPENEDFERIAFPGGTGGVREDRYEAILSYGRPLTDNLSLQITAGGEYSQISQTGRDALARTFRRPKGSLALAWAPADSLDVNFEVARRVGQLDFIDFLAQVNITDDNASAGNNRLRPQQSWELELEVAKGFGDWGSATLTLFDERIEDFVTIVPVGDGGEASGNIDSARRYGLVLDATLRTDPLGLEGGQFDILLEAEESNLEDPLTGIDRRFDRSEPRNLEINFRHDIAETDWAYGLEFRDTQFAPYFRVGESGLDYSIDTFAAAYIEHKDVAGLTVRARAGNLFNEEIVLVRTVYDGPRNSGPVLFSEDRRRKIGIVFNFRVSGSF